MISCQWFKRKRLSKDGPKLHKITHHTMKNKLGRGLPKEHPPQKKSVQRFGRGSRKTVFERGHVDADDGHRVIARVTFTH